MDLHRGIIHTFKLSFRLNKEDFFKMADLTQFVGNKKENGSTTLDHQIHGIKSMVVFCKANGYISYFHFEITRNALNGFFYITKPLASSNIIFYLKYFRKYFKIRGKTGDKGQQSC